MPTRRTVMVAAAGGLAAAAVAGGVGSGGLGSGGLLAAAEPVRRHTDPYRPKRQLRGLWIATVVNLNWPSKPGLTAEQQQLELNAWFDLAVDRGYNAVMLQVRSAAQVLYDSPLEPWSAYLTGTQGEDPGYDPLGFAVSAAHQRGLELHAWFNPYQLVRAGQNHNTAPNHPSVTHPEWAVAYAGAKYFNPGLPEARQWVEDAIMVAVKRYDIDAVHFDDYFYPYPVDGQTFDDADAYARYGGDLELADWRRENVNTLVREMAERIKQAKPHVKFGISPFAIWRNAATDPAGSDTTGSQSYDTIYADTRHWVQQGWLDYICPQVYWAQSFTVAPYDTVVDWWCDQVRGRDISLYIGEAAYKIGDPAQPTWADPEEMSNHLLHDSRSEEVVGNVYFSIPYVRDDPLGGMTRMEKTWYSRPALVPPMPWIDDTPPDPVGRRNLNAVRSSSGVELRVVSGDKDVARYAIYRLPLTHRPIRRGDPRLADATYLAAVVAAEGVRNGMRWADVRPEAEGRTSGAHGGDGSTYVVTALDRLWNESDPVSVNVRHS
ncbi:glycoside hydrolase family 10 protein [Microlunatus soli]|uniref:Uncharacterized lipoprotein YddW, UPF0748 family n=1 Tax=Microlunatus soli TaxID=630515 RepID=A0A1H1ZBJ6_9ACTN|nr:family 10 glycosylhydrolase [Microlunatus soli]SDT31040.1 Uncharacterized lipoprotein YddW, UPF0748 family [Microlunatus soli]